LSNKIIINQDSIDGYEGLGFDMSTFNQDGLGDLFTIGICQSAWSSIETLFCGQNNVVAHFHLICQA
jgi:hypothetical protein